MTWGEDDLGDGGFEADLGGASVEDGVDAAVEVVEDVLGGGGTGVGEGVSRGRGDGDAGLPEELERDRVVGLADADECPAGG